MKFVPADITVHKGDTVIWINKDMVAHDVTEETAKAWTSSPISFGGSWKMEVTEEADYYCSIHAVMKGKLKLE
jgi:plastocyanin